MSYILIISEKPQAAQKIANSFGNAKKIRENEVNYFQVEYKKQNIIVASAVGHLFILGEKGGESWKYPIFETEWKSLDKVNKKNSYVKNYSFSFEKIKKECERICCCLRF